MASGDEPTYEGVVVAGMVEQQLRAVQHLPCVVEVGGVYRLAGWVTHLTPWVEFLPFGLALSTHVVGHYRYRAQVVGVEVDCVWVGPGGG